MIDRGQESFNIVPHYELIPGIAFPREPSGLLVNRRDGKVPEPRLSSRKPAGAFRLPSARMLAYDSRGSQKESVSAAIRGRERPAADKSNDLNAQIESGRVPRYVRACVSHRDRDKSLTRRVYRPCTRAKSRAARLDLCPPLDHDCRSIARDWRIGRNRRATIHRDYGSPWIEAGPCARECQVPFLNYYQWQRLISRISRFRGCQIFHSFNSNAILIVTELEFLICDWVQEHFRKLRVPFSFVFEDFMNSFCFIKI